MTDNLTRPIMGIENRTPLEVWQIMCDRITNAAASIPASRGVGTHVALQAARAAFNVEYDEDGKVMSVGYDSNALRPLIALLDAALASPAPQPVQEQEPDGYLCSAPPGVWASGPEVTSGQYAQSWKDKGYTCVPYFLASPPEQELTAKVITQGDIDMAKRAAIAEFRLHYGGNDDVWPRLEAALNKMVECLKP